ncbi:MAG TPA: tetratricopeptide repeat protein [Gallionella sp.]|nr:tetratricopeptide repeat protein [Gallionella sp.]
MNILDHFARLAVLLTGTLMLSASLAAHADDMADASRLFKQGQRSQALDKVNEYLINNPKDAQARFLKGLIFTEQGKTADAVRIFSALTDDYPDLPEPYNNLAVLYASQGQYDKAKKLLERAISTHPSYATAHENLGDIYAKMASQAYDRALQLDHGNTATQTKLAMIQNLFAPGKRDNETVAQNTPVLSQVEVSATSKVEAAPVVAETAQPEPAPATHAASAGVSKPASTVATEHAARTEKSAEVTQTVMAWAAAWSSKNTGRYLSFYAEDFKTPDGETRASWEAARRERISAPKFIHVGIRIQTITFTDSTHATVKFRQSYRSSHLKTSGNKTLLMVKSGAKWLIQEERSR